MAILNNERIPVSTDTMDYSLDTHRFKLTTTAVDNAFHVSFATFAGTTDNAEALLDEISSDIYKTIYLKSRAMSTSKRRTIAWTLAYNPDVEFILEQVMLDYVRATMRSDWALVKDLNPVKKASGIVMDFSELPSIAPDALDGLKAYGLLFSGGYTYQIPDEEWEAKYGVEF